MSWIRDNLGTDILLGTWFMTIGALLYVVVTIYDLNYSIQYADDDFSTTNSSLLVASSVVFFVATAYFIKSSYPEEMNKFMNDIANVDVKTLTFTQRYFTGNSWLIATWLSFIATFTYFVYPIWAYTNGYIGVAYFVLYILSLSIVMFFILLWIVAVFPESLVLNNGQGSSYFYDYVLNNNVICCCGDSKFWRLHCGSDFLVGTWVFAIVSVISVPSTIIYTCEYPTYWISYVTLLCIIFLAIGSILFVYSSYPGNFNSAYFYKILFNDPNYVPSDFVGTANERSSILRNSEL